MECPNCHESIHKSHLAEYEAIFRETHHLKELRTTNHPASQVEIHYVHNELLPAIKNDKKHLKKKISELRASVELLEQEEESLDELIDNFRSIISPLRRLPPELLMEIFQHACEEESSLYPKAMPHVVSQVSRGWRQVAVSCRDIWSRFYYAPTLGVSQAINPALERALTRSANFPPSLQMRKPHFRASGTLAQAFLERIHPHVARCRCLELYIDSTFAATAFSILRNDHPLVEHLDLNILPEVAAVPQTGFSRYPNLRTVVLHDSRIITTDLPWHGITTLIISASFVAPAGDMKWYLRPLLQCPMLQALTIEPVDSRRGIHRLTDRTFLVTLKDLKGLDTSFNLFLDHLCLPQLETARLSTVHHQDYPGTKQIRNILSSFTNLVFRSNSASKLNSLRLDKIPITEDLLPLLSLTPNLVTLDICAEMGVIDSYSFECEPDEEATATIMTLVGKLEVLPGEGASFLPRLDCISICLSQHVDRYSFPYLDHQDDLVRTLQSRWNVGNSLGLQRLTTFKYWIMAQFFDDLILNCPELGRECENALEHLVADGMDISICARSELVRLYTPAVMVDFGCHFDIQSDANYGY